MTRLKYQLSSVDTSDQNNVSAIFNKELNFMRFKYRLSSVNSIDQKKVSAILSS